MITNTSLDEMATMFTMDRHLSDEALAALQLARRRQSIKRTSTDVARFKRSRKMTNRRSNKYAKTGHSHRDKSRNTPDCGFYNVGREGSRPSWARNLLRCALQPTDKKNRMVRCRPMFVASDPLNTCRCVPHVRVLPTRRTQSSMIP